MIWHQGSCGQGCTPVAELAWHAHALAGLWPEPSIAPRTTCPLPTRHGVTKVRAAGELLSSIMLLEAAVKAQEQVLGFRDPSIRAASRKAENLLSALSGQERQLVGPPPPC